jgi:hypothetical protein
MAIDILKAFREEPPPLDFVLPGLVRGTVGAIVSPGGTGKSMLALEIAILVASGFDLSGIAGEKTFPVGKVVFLAAEDPEVAILQRLHALGKMLPDDVRVKLSENLIIEPLLGKLPNVMNQKWFDAIKRVSEGSRLLILDTLRRFHISDENDSGEMSQVIGQLEAISAPNDCATIFAHHSSKSAALTGQGDQQQASRGSSVLVDNIRWQMYLAGMTKDEASKFKIAEERRGYFVRTGVSKQNYGSPTQELWLLRVDGGVLTPADKSSGMGMENNTNMATVKPTTKKSGKGKNWL